MEFGCHCVPLLHFHISLCMVSVQIQICQLTVTGRIVEVSAGGSAKRCAPGSKPAGATSNGRPWC